MQIVWWGGRGHRKPLSIDFVGRTHVLWQISEYCCSVPHFIPPRLLFFKFILLVCPLVPIVLQGMSPSLPLYLRSSGRALLCIFPFVVSSFTVFSHPQGHCPSSYHISPLPCSNSLLLVSQPSFLPFPVCSHCQSVKPIMPLLCLRKPGRLLFPLG